jgi:phage terminase Nu1 subunit (DNA packaging protein)
LWAFLKIIQLRQGVVVVVSEALHDAAPELVAVEVDAALAEMLARFPLPSGVQDADCNQEEIAQALNTTVNTVAKWIRQDGMPVAQPGGNGRAYVLRLSHCYAWKKAQQADLDLRSRHNRDQVAKMQASFLGLDLDDPQANMTPAQRREAAMADIAWSKAAHMRRQLVPLQDVVDLLETLFQICRDGIEAMPDRLEREINLKPEQVASVVRAGSDILNKMSEHIEERELRERDVPDVDVQERWLI